jgi:hypothetical protein
MSKPVLYIVSIVVILLIGSSIWPYWNKYMITSDLKSAAAYGTKHDIEELQSLVHEKLKERGCVFDSENLNIEKDDQDNVSISLTYKDKIDLFGIVLKELQFTVEIKQDYVNEVF